MRQGIYKKIVHTQAFRMHFRLTWSPKPATGTRNQNHSYFHSYFKKYRDLNQIFLLSQYFSRRFTFPAVDPTNKLTHLTVAHLQGLRKQFGPLFCRSRPNYYCSLFGKSVPKDYPRCTKQL